MEINWGALDRARALYERLLDKTQHVNAFKGYATFEWKKAEQKDRARQVTPTHIYIYMYIYIYIYICI